MTFHPRYPVNSGGAFGPFRQANRLGLARCVVLPPSAPNGGVGCFGLARPAGQSGEGRRWPTPGRRGRVSGDGA
jgi:hypothetical protein